MDETPVTPDHKLEEVITGRPQKRARKVVFLVASVVIIALFGLGLTLANSIGKIKTKNYGGGSPWLRLSGLNPNALKGEGDGRINILLLGMGGAKHPGGLLSDTIIVASLDPKNDEAAFLSIPRDLYVKYPQPLHGAGKINTVYAFGEQDKLPGGGANVAKKAVSDLLGLPIHYYVRVDFEGFKKIVDALGGVTVTVEKDLNDPLYPDKFLQGYDPFYIKAGTHNLSGEIALKYARSRETTSDFDRARRQQQIMLAVKDKASSTKVIANPAKLVEIAKILGNHLKTDLTIKEMERLTALARDIKSDKIVTRVLDNSISGPLVTQSTEQGYFLVLRDQSGKEIKQIAHDIFKDPYLHSEAAKIEIHNASSSTGAGSRLAEELQSLGYQIVKVQKAPTVVSTTQIIDLTLGKKPVTLQYLLGRLHAKKTTTKVDSNADLVIVLGDDYVNSNETKPN